MAGDPYKAAKKEMETLLKVEGGVSYHEIERQKKEQQKRQRSQVKDNIKGEEASRLGASAPSGQSGAYGTGDLSDEDFDIGADLMPSQGEMMKDLAEKAGLEYRDIGEFDLKDEKKIDRLTSYITSITARERRVMPVDEQEVKNGRPLLTIAIADPMDIRLVDDLRLMLPEHDIYPVVCKEEDIVDAIDNAYGVGEEGLDDVIDVLNQEAGGDDMVVGREGEVEINVEDLANQPSVIKLVSLLLIQAVKDRASDLHIEPFAGQLRIRYRIDGVLREIPSPPKNLQLGLMSRIKVMAKLRIDETRRPQDGRIRLNVEGREIDLRVACVPTVHGESIVMRVLDKSSMMIGVQQLGIPAEVMEGYLKRCRKPNGIVLVTGPTGSGKTTTLYATLREIYEPGMKFITTEDPVEYELPGIVQVNINAKVGLTFAACLRSILRQDPDVILVGEIRDVETAQISIQAALTGHLVLSTLHTNSAAATITRLVDMGVEPFLLTSTLEAVVGQRLIRTICPSCRVPYIPTDEELEEFGVERDEVSEIDFFQGRGCDDCNYSGYKGRQGLYEIMEVTESINELILQRATTDDIHALAVHEGMMTMRQDGWLKICLGMTTFEEVSKHTIPETEASIKAEMESVRKSLALISQAQKQREDEDNFVPDELETGEEEVINFEDSAPSMGSLPEAEAMPQDGQADDSHLQEAPEEFPTDEPETPEPASEEQSAESEENQAPPLSPPIDEDKLLE